MGSRGPLTNPTSIRGEREARKARKAGNIAELPSESLRMPGWLPDGNRETWRRIVAGLRKARVPLRTIDADAVGFYVACIEGVADALAKSDAALAARFERDAIQWAGQIGATPAARARMGIKQPAREPVNRFAQFKHA